MSWTTDDIPDLRGRTAAVTGANGGLGLETAWALAGAGATVVMAARNQQKAVAARTRILGEYPAAELELVEVDLHPWRRSMLRPLGSSTVTARSTCW